ncbi:MAG: N-acetylmuramoyl-L-alanine amidase [Aeromonadaceae bacterium]
MVLVPVQANELKRLRVSPTADKTRVVFDLADAPRYTYSQQQVPPRLIIELDNITSELGNSAQTTGRMGPAISAIARDKNAPAGKLRLVFSLTALYKPTIFTLKPQQHYGHRLVIDLDHNVKQAVPTTSPSSAAVANASTPRSAVSGSATSSTRAPAASGTASKPVSGRIIPMSEFSPQSKSANRQANSVTVREEVLSTQTRPAASANASAVTASTSSPALAAAANTRAPSSQTTSSTTAMASPEPRNVAPKPVSSGNGMLIVAVDAGHGGKDPGAIGPGGTHEKNVTLAVARELARLINRQPGMKAIMTRDGDYFVDLDRRSEIARQKKANLLISIHADSVDNASARGASVWILSSKRVDREMNKLLEQQDKHTELLGGAGKVIAESEPNPYLAQTILDLSWDNSRSEGYSIGEVVLQQIGRVARLHKSKPVHASLAVLKAPDIPSLLIETGFISNHLEERQLASATYQRDLARAIFRGVQGYYADNPPEGTRIAAVPQPDNKSGKSIRHVVKNGESLSGLAVRYGIPKGRLASYNSLKSEHLLIGQVLYIPAS